MRLDQWLFEQSYFDSKEKAKREVLAGLVREKASGTILDKPGMRVKGGLEVLIQERQRFVSRAGEKLDGFLGRQSWSPEGKLVLDVGSSTGGFTDCVLQRGAARVVAVDVGTHQLHEKLRVDPRVRLYEKTDIRQMDFSLIEGSPDWILIDVSFISARKILLRLKEAFPKAFFILLFKPQFESGRFVPKHRGVIREDARLQSLEEMLHFLRQVGFNLKLVEDSLVKGMKGNQETFIAMTVEHPEHIFRAYDVRGHAAHELTDEIFEKIGYALGRRVVEESSAGARVGIGRDARDSSPRLFEALCRGLARHELKLVDLGVLPTPMVYFANHQLDLQAAFQITASHNPAPDNGLKMMIGKSTLSGETIRQIGAEVESLTLPESRTGEFEEHWNGKLKSKYLEYLHQQFGFKKKFKLVLDTANGMSGLVAREAFEPYCESLDILYEDVDCRFPNHPADPTVAANLEALIERVRSTGADLGLAFDGDGDRLGLVSASGRIFWGDEILMLLSEKVLRDQPGAIVIGEVKCSEKLFEMIRQRGGKPEMYQAGHSLIKKRMQELGAPLAGEMSGHLFFADRYFGFDDGVYAGLRVLEVISDLELCLDTWIQGFPALVNTPEIRVVCTEEEKFKLVDGVKTFFESFDGVKLNTIDGVRVRFPDGAWLLVRASNTQAVLVVRFEAESSSRLEQMRCYVEEALGRPVPHV